jgi:membrane protease YdiL (CAAX protease family)
VVTLFAPFWEETIFRGFLLPSLCRYLPAHCAVAAAAAAFALAHFSAERLLPLAALGLVLGAAFVRTRSLGVAMLIHAAWNAYAFAELLLQPS